MTNRVYTVPATLIVIAKNFEVRRYPLAPTEVQAVNSRRAVNAAFYQQAVGSLERIVGNEDGTLMLYSNLGEIIEYRLTNITREEVQPCPNKLP